MFAVDLNMLIMKSFFRQSSRASESIAITFGMYRSIFCHTAARILMSFSFVLCHVSLGSWLINQIFSRSTVWLFASCHSWSALVRTSLVAKKFRIDTKPFGIGNVCANWMRKLKFIRWIPKLNRLLQRVTIKISFDCSLKRSRPNTCNVAQNNNSEPFTSFD